MRRHQSNLLDRVASRWKTFSRGSLWLLICISVQACSTVPASPDVETRTGEFSPPLAEAHFSRLTELGPRLPGAESTKLGLAYLERELRLAGATTTRLGVGELGTPGHLVATISGGSKDVILLMAPWSLLGDERWGDAAGAALLLALASSLNGESPAYTVELVLVGVQPERRSGVGREKDSASGTWSAVTSIEAARERVLISAQDAISALREAGRLKQLRAAIVVEPRAGAAAPRMARDLRSHPIFRSLIWDTAAELGYEEIFPGDGEWRSPSGLQQALQQAGYSQVVSLVDESEPAGTARSIGQPASARTESGIGPVGLVVHEALMRLMGRFERIDAFSK